MSVCAVPAWSPAECVTSCFCNGMHKADKKLCSIWFFCYLYYIGNCIETHDLILKIDIFHRRTTRISFRQIHQNSIEQLSKSAELKLKIRNTKKGIKFLSHFSIVFKISWKSPEWDQASRPVVVYSRGGEGKCPFSRLCTKWGNAEGNKRLGAKEAMVSEGFTSW